MPVGSSLTGFRIAADGDRVVVRDGSSIWNPESGQSLFDFAVSELMEKATPFDRRPNVTDARTADQWYEVGCDSESISSEEAQRAYERALELDDEHADAHVNLGRLLHEEGAPVAAEEHYRRGMDLDPEHETAAFNLGVALEDLGRVGGAMEQLNCDPARVWKLGNGSGLRCIPERARIVRSEARSVNPRSYRRFDVAVDHRLLHREVVRVPHGGLRQRTFLWREVVRTSKSEWSRRITLPGDANHAVPLLHRALCS